MPLRPFDLVSSCNPASEVLILFGLDALGAYIAKYGSLVSYLAPGSAGTPPSDEPILSRPPSQFHSKSSFGPEVP